MIRYIPPLIFVTITFVAYWVVSQFESPDAQARTFIALLVFVCCVQALVLSLGNVANFRIRDFPMLVVGAASVVVLLLQALTLRNSDETLKIQTRAWLAPLPVSAPPNFVDRKVDKTTIAFRFENVGKEPAARINEQVFVDVIDWQKFDDKEFMLANIKRLLGGHDCESFEPNLVGRAVFPTKSAGQTIDLEAERIGGVLKDPPTHYTLVTGCLIHRTVASTHRTKFCSILVAPHRSNNFEWQPVLCPIHNDAD
jgi:hypothetical protein